MKTVYISFQDVPRIYVNQVPPAEYPFIKNPDLKKVRGIPMNKWSPELFKEPVIMRISRLYGFQIVIGSLGAMFGAGLLFSALKWILKVL